MTYTTTTTQGSPHSARATPPTTSNPNVILSTAATTLARTTDAQPRVDVRSEPEKSDVVFKPSASSVNGRSAIKSKLAEIYKQRPGPEHYKKWLHSQKPFSVSKAMKLQIQQLSIWYPSLAGIKPFALQSLIGDKFPELKDKDRSRVIDGFLASVSVFSSQASHAAAYRIVHHFSLPSSLGSLLQVLSDDFHTFGKKVIDQCYDDLKHDPWFEPLLKCAKHMVRDCEYNEEFVRIVDAYTKDLESPPESATAPTVVGRTGINQAERQEKQPNVPDTREAEQEERQPLPRTLPPLTEIALASGAVASRPMRVLEASEQESEPGDNAKSGSDVSEVKS